MEQEKNISKKENKKIFSTINYTLLFILIILVGYNQININDIDKIMGINQNNPLNVLETFFKGNKNNLYKTSADKNLTGDLNQDSINLVISKGVPKIYGKELGVSFDSVQKSMNIMRKYDPYELRPGGERIIPKGNNLKRYIDIGSKIACEYCCSAKTLVNKNGQAACGCAHSMAMRGLAAYLLQNHPEMSNDEILRELARWKGMFFPKQMITKMMKQLKSGNYTPDTASLLIGLKLPDYGNGSKNIPLPSEVKNLPEMVGGC